MDISEVTRRNVIDVININKVNWSGRLEETEFLARLYNLSDLPSTDVRFSDAGGDIWQHRFNNFDWNDDWVFHDSRFNLLFGPDKQFLDFLCETIHPAVREDNSEVETLLSLYNAQLEQDGYRLIEVNQISGRPVYEGLKFNAATTATVSFAQKSFDGTDAAYINRQIERMTERAESDPDLAIGTAKELIESCCKTILDGRNIEYAADIKIAKLVKKVFQTLRLTPDDISDEAKAAKTIKVLLSNLSTVAQGISELRNAYGTGHGKAAKTKGLEPRHARLVIGTASTLVAFLAETHNKGNENL